MDKETMLKFHEAFNWLQDHPMLVCPEIANLNWFPSNLSIEVVMVNPKTRRTDGDEPLTDVDIWLEFGPINTPTPEEAELWGCDTTTPIYGHDLDCDCGGPTFEEAVIKLAELVKKKYGTYTPDCFTPLNHKEYCTGERKVFGGIFEEVTPEE
jgi:hypothetical protein